MSASGWDVGGTGKEQVKDDKGCLSNLRKLTSGFQNFTESTLKIQNNLTIAGGNADAFTL